MPYTTTFVPETLTRAEVDATRGPLVLEVNSSPGLQGVEAASGKDVAGKIIDFLELKASRKHKPAE